MSPVLEHPELRESLLPLSVEFYHEMGRMGQLGEDVELLDGFVFKKMPKSPLHETIVRRCARLLLQCLPQDCFLAKESPLTLAYSEPEPDLAVIEGEEEDFVLRHPDTALLVIEVAISTVQRDRTKAGIYSLAGVGEYWLIEPESGKVTVYRQPTAAGFENVTAYSGRDMVKSTILSGFQLEVAELLRWPI
jgi:Uma2 family endonuclease